MDAVASKPGVGDSADVVIAGHLRPVLLQHGARIGFDLAERRGLEAARLLETVGEAANAGEQVQGGDHAATASHVGPKAAQRCRSVMK